MHAVPGTTGTRPDETRERAMTSATDYDPIADKYAAGVDQRRFNALYERPATLALLPDVRPSPKIGLGSVRCIFISGRSRRLPNR